MLTHAQGETVERAKARARAQKIVDTRKYRKLTSMVDTTAERVAEREHLEVMRSYRYQLGIGLDMLFTLGAAFVIGYVTCRNAFAHQLAVSLHTLLALVCAR
jgi:hypothetical protein